MKERTPAKAKEYTRDLNGNRENVVRNLFRKSGNTLEVSMKQFARKLANGEASDPTGESKAAAERWLFNKRVNFSKPPLGLGSTRKKKNKDGKKP